MPPDEGRPVVPARLHGLHRGADVSGDVELMLEEHGLRLAIAGGPVLPVVWGALDGVHHSGSTLTLFLVGDDVLELDDVAGAEALARAIAERTCRLGELTLALRGLGSGRANPGSDHHRFYGPLLVARRALEDARSPEAQLAAVDAGRLADAVKSTLAGFAADRYPKVAADRRALEAELLDHAAGLMRALDRLAVAREAASQSPTDARFAWWREWASALRTVFAEHDRTWIAALPALCDPRGQQGRFWRRLLGFGRRAPVLAFGGALASALASASLPAQADDGVRETVRVVGARGDSLRDALRARGFDVVLEHGDTMLVVVGPAERARLAREGFAASPLVRGAEARRRAGLRAGEGAATATVVYRSWDDPVRGVRAWLDSLAAALPGLVRLETIGETWEGRPIVAARIGRARDDASDDPARANVVFTATYHAREWIATEVALRLVRHLATSADPRARALVDARDVWVVPVVNPDGYQYAHATDRLWRKNRRPGAPYVGVDLNRNHAMRWGLDDRGSSPLASAETYRGPSAASEPETQAVQRLHDRVRPVVGVSYHSFGRLVLWSPGYAAGLLPQDQGVHRALAGTDLAPAIRDRTPGANGVGYHPGPGWQLYLTNGDYDDWAASEGVLAFTPELTSGCLGDCAEGFYGFEFPDDEALIEQVFQDNLPFALDVIEAAADPRAFVSPTTGLSVPRLALESVSPMVRVRVPVGAAGATQVRVVDAGGRSGVLAVRRDTVASSVFEARLVSSTLQRRAAGVEVATAAARAQWRTLLAGGAEPGDAGWSTAGWIAVTAGATEPVAGSGYWESALEAPLRTPLVAMPDDADTLVVAWWQQHAVGLLGAPGAGVAGEVRVTLDDGATHTVARVGGNASAWYPEQARLGGVRGRTLRVEFAPTVARWRIDEVSVLAEGSALPVAGAGTRIAVRPSANPVRGPRVTFAWPPDAGAGELAVYDFAGHLVWRRTMAAGETSATWEVASRALANGAYLVLARAGPRAGRLTLYVAR